MKPLRTKYRIISSLLLFFSLTSCLKDVYDGHNRIPGEGPNPFGNTKVAEGFDWSMINSPLLTVQPFDNYEGRYDYLIEVFNLDPNDPKAELLATGIANKFKVFSKKIVYPKGNPNTVYVQQTDPSGHKTVKTISLTMTTAAGNLCAFDETSLPDTPGTPKNQKVTRNPVFNYTFIVEDSFPLYGDYDFNDIAADIRLETVTNGMYVEQIIFNIEYRAIGASKRCGAYIHLPTLKREDIKNTMKDNWAVNSEPGNTPLFPLSDDLHGLFGFYEIINTLDKSAYRGTRSNKLTITLNANAIKDFTILDTDFFTEIVRQEGSLRNEVHLRNYPNTSRGLPYQYYSKDNFVWALLIPYKLLYPQESFFLGVTHKNLLKWVSGDQSQVQWYKQADTEKVYTRP